jgi:hypothetical protein
MPSKQWLSEQFGATCRIEDHIEGTRCRFHANDPNLATTKDSTRCSHNPSIGWSKYCRYAALYRLGGKGARGSWFTKFRISTYRHRRSRCHSWSGCGCGRNDCLSRSRGRCHWCRYRGRRDRGRRDRGRRSCCWTKRDGCRRLWAGTVVGQTESADQGCWISFGTNIAEIQHRRVQQFRT